MPPLCAERSIVRGDASAHTRTANRPRRRAAAYPHRGAPRRRHRKASSVRLRRGPSLPCSVAVLHCIAYARPAASASATSTLPRRACTRLPNSRNLPCGLRASLACPLPACPPSMARKSALAALVAAAACLVSGVAAQDAKEVRVAWHALGGQAAHADAAQDVGTVIGVDLGARVALASSVACSRSDAPLLFLAGTTYSCVACGSAASGRATVRR